MIELRPYQQTAISQAFRQWHFHEKILLVMATGTGKTATACELSQRVFNKCEKRILFIAHRQELIEQTAKSFRRMTRLKPAVEMGADRAYRRLFDTDVIVASVQSLAQPERLKQYTPEKFALVIIDEAHHACAEIYRRVLKHFEGKKILGLTATPFRADGIGLNNIFDIVAFSYTIQEGIKDGFLCPIQSKQIEVETLHLDKIKVTKGEFNEKEINYLLMQEENLSRMVIPTLEEIGERPTIVFCTDVAHAISVAECFNRTAGRDIATFIHGKLNDRDRRESLRKYETGERQIIVNVGVLTEGYDYPPTAAVALFRPMRSLGLLAQMVGRGTRIWHEKQDTLVLDFVGAHNTVQTVNALDVLDGTKIEDSVKRRAQQLAKEKELNAVDALDMAKREALRAKELEMKMRVAYRSTPTGIIELFNLSTDRRKYRGAATDKQIQTLVKFGVEVDKEKVPFGKAEASAIIDNLFTRRDKNMATLKQSKLLAKYGYDDAFDISFEEAGRRIDTLAKNGWKVNGI